MLKHTPKAIRVSIAVVAACGLAEASSNAAQLASSAARVRTAATRIISVVAEDFDGDGRRDIAYTQEGLTYLCVVFGKADGTYTLPAMTNLGEAGALLTAGEFTGDGRLDLAVAKPNAAAASIWANTGRGGFTMSSEVFVGGHPRSILAADLNQDGILELVVTNTDLPETRENVAIVERLFNGNYASYGVSAGPGVSTAAANDFDADGRTDLVFGYDRSSRLVGFCWNGHDSMGRPLAMGGFAPVTYLPGSNSGEYPTQVLVAHADGDNRPDIVFTNVDEQVIGVVLNDGTANVAAWRGDFDYRFELSSPAVISDLKRTARYTANWTEYDPAANDYALFRLSATQRPNNTIELTATREWSLGQTGYFAILSAPDLDMDRDPDVLGVDGRYVYASGNPNTNKRPTIAGLRFDRDPIMSGRDLTITASGVSDADADGAIREVRFYRDTNRDGALDAADELIGTDASGADGWSLTRRVDSSWGAGTLRIIALASDELGEASDPRANSLVVRTNQKPLVGSLIASHTTRRFGQPFTLTAPGVGDSDADLGDGVARVEVFMDADGDGALTSRDPLLKTMTLDPSVGWRASFRASRAMGAGNKLFFVRAIDSEGAISDAAAVRVRITRR